MPEPVSTSYAHLDLNGQQVHLLLLNGEPAGFTTTRMDDVHDAVVVRLWVAPAFRGQGVATMLADHHFGPTNEHPDTRTVVTNGVPHAVKVWYAIRDIPVVPGDTFAPSTEGDRIRDELGASEFADIVTLWRSQ